MAKLTLEHVLQNVRRLLNVIGEESACKACRTKIWYVKHKNGKTAPYTETGLNHFADCPEAPKFRKLPLASEERLPYPD